jgi:hypothetical protein
MIRNFWKWFSKFNKLKARVLAPNVFEVIEINTLLVKSQLRNTAEISLKNDKQTLINIYHFQKFAGEGLRTLALAERHIDEEFFGQWRKKQKEIALTIDGRDGKLDELYEEIECDMLLVGKCWWSSIPPRMQHNRLDSFSI